MIGLYALRAEENKRNHIPCALGTKERIKRKWQSFNAARIQNQIQRKSKQKK